MNRTTKTSNSLILALMGALLVSCGPDDDFSEVSVGGEGYVSGPAELGGRVGVAVDKSLYEAMETAAENGDVPIPGSSLYDDLWFALASGDRIRLLEVDAEQAIGRVEILSGFSAGKTGWIS